MTKENKAQIKPELASGFRDYLPADMIPRQKMFDIIRGVFERFGFVPLDTPALEKESILTGGDPNFRMQIYRAGLRGSKDELALHFDLTVPLARVIAQYPEIKKPFKRYQSAKVWRGERAQAGRYREFVQFDADIVGSKEMTADAEIISIMNETMTALGISNFLVKVNNRKILNGLAEYAGFSPDKLVSVLRIIDKLDKIGWEGVDSELRKTSAEDNDETADFAGLNDSQVRAIKSFIDLKADGKKEILDRVEELMENSPSAREGIKELREIIEHVKALGVSDDKWAIDLSVARGLGYYTGPVFETVLTDLLSIGSVFSGGRYDDLVSRFSSSVVPATGASVGVDRLFAAMSQLKLLSKQEATAKVLVLNFDKTCELVCERLATVLRQANIPTEIYFGNENNLKGQLSYAVSQEVPVVLIVGSSEREKNTVTVKDMKKRIQKEVPQSELIDVVTEIIE